MFFFILAEEECVKVMNATWEFLVLDPHGAIKVSRGISHQDFQGLLGMDNGTR